MELAAFSTSPISFPARSGDTAIRRLGELALQGYKGEGVAQEIVQVAGNAQALGAHGQARDFLLRLP